MRHLLISSWFTAASSMAMSQSQPAASQPAIRAEELMKTMGQTPEEQKLMEKFKDMNEMYVSGSREIFKVW